MFLYRNHAQDGRKTGGTAQRSGVAGRDLDALAWEFGTMAYPVSPRPLLHLYLVGPMRVTDAEGRKIVIRGRKALALLALTALGPQMQRSRAWLRDKLWSGSDETRAATSLRQSLFELRRDLGPVGAQVLDITADAVALDPALVWVDQIALAADATLFRKLGLREDSDLLEGFDINDPEFEDWLQMARMQWADQAEDLAACQPARFMPAPDLPRDPVQLALLRSVTHGGDELTAHLSDQLIERFSYNLSEIMPLRVYDLRHAAAPIEELARSAEAQFFCRMRVLCVGKSVTLTFLLYRAAELTLEWSQSIHCEIDELCKADSLVLLGFVAQNVDRSAKTLAAASPPTAAPGASQMAGYAAMNLIFRLDDGALTQALDVLARACATPQDCPPTHSLFHALRAYTASFAVGENLGAFSAADRLQLRQEIAAALAENPFNAVALACYGHVLGYVFHEHALAGKVLERAVAQNPSQAFAWDHFALHKLYCGDYDSALRHAQKATQLGAYSPLSYSYDTTLAMAATLAGDYGRATLAGQSAVQKQPRFKAALRYLMVAQGATGRRDAAEQTRDRLLQVDPGFRQPEVRLMRFGIQDARSAHPLLSHLKKLME